MRQAELVLVINTHADPDSGDLFYTAQNYRNQVKMLYLVGLGLADEKDITVRGLEVVKSASRVYLEAYTSILLVEKAKLVGSLSHD